MALLTNSYFQNFIKLAIVGSALYFISIKIDQTALASFHLSITDILILAIFSLFNWVFEILKWKNLANHIQKTSFRQAVKQSLSSHTAAIITPNKIGEYGAKAIYFSNKKKALGLNFISNSYQLLTTLFFGIIGLLIINMRYPKIIFNFNAIAIFVVIICFLILGTYISRKKLMKYISFLKNIPINRHRNTLIYSILRYLVFSHQLLFLLLIFNIEIDYFTAMPLILSMYLLASILPNFAILDFIVKGSVAIFLFSLESISATTITSIIGISWILNFALPAFIGCAYVIRYKPNISYDTI